MRRHSSIVIWSDDHMGDSLGAVFMLDATHAGDAVIEKLRDYLGSQIRILKAVVSREKIEVEAECATFRDESERLIDSARGLRRNRLYRSAESTLREALKLDPLSPHALIALAEVLHDAERFSDAIEMLIRAREVSAHDTPQVLSMLGECCLKVERTASAIRYFETALALDPRHVGARRALLALGRRPSIGAPKRDADDPLASPRKPQAKK
jgi:tetratricopeptide (TPR) repeat protein